jgi:anti-sigma factor RsiW
MIPCWQEGEWRAYVDGELPAEDMARGSEHLATCEACAGLHREIAERAGRVSVWMAELETAPAIASPRKGARPTWKWAAAGAALAAALVAAFVLAPGKNRVVEAPRAVEAIAIRPAAAPAVTPAVVKRRVPAKARRRRTQTQYFLAFDDEPIDTGTVMRVALDGGVEADLIVDASGRPRAIRPVH